MFGGDAPEVLGDRVEGLVPIDLDPARIGIALWPGPLQRTQQSFGMINNLRCDLAFQTQGLACRMLRISIKSDELPVSHGGNRAAARNAQGTKAGDSLAVVIHHGLAHSSIWYVL